MARARRIALLVGLLCLPVIVEAVSLDGILISSTDTLGNPFGFDPNSAQPLILLWHTQRHDPWHGLGVLAGLPPESLLTAPLNAPDFSIHLPLAEGENDFTVVGAMGGREGGQLLALYLFFDGELEYPGISMLIPPNAPLSGIQPMPNQSDIAFSLSVELVSIAPQTTYDDGTVTVSVDGASFLAPDPSLDVAIVAPHSLVGDGTKDWVGVLRLIVEAPPPPNVSPPRGLVPLAGAVNTGPGVRVGPDLSGGPGPQPRGEMTGAAAPKQVLEPGLQGLAGTPAPENTPPAASPSQAPTVDPSVAAGAASPNPAVTTAPTGGSGGTPTPAATPALSARTARASPSSARTSTARDVAATPSPAAPGLTSAGRSPLARSASTLH